MMSATAPPWRFALADLYSGEFQQAKRLGGAVSDIIVIEGYDGALPG